MSTRSQGQAVPPECKAYYNTLKTTSQDTLRIIEKITKNNKNSLSDLRENDPLLAAVCSTMNTQKAAYDKWHDEIELLNKKLEELNPRRGGSQNGGEQILICPDDFQKIFNYMFLIAASASIAVMSPDINLVTNVCMKALTLVFGTIVLPIINLLRVVFMFMLQSLVLIVKTVGSLAIKIISNFIKIVYLNIHTIASGAIGISKVFIYRSLTYCKSFYNKVVSLMPKEKIAADTDDLKDREDVKLPEPKVTDIKPEEVGKINESMNAAIRGEIIDPDMSIDIEESSDIFMDMLTQIDNKYKAVVDTISFGYTFLKTAYMFLCDKAHTQFKDTLGGEYYSNRVKLYITKGLFTIENNTILTLNGVANIPTVTTYYIKSYIKSLFLRLLKAVLHEKYSDPDETPKSKRVKKDITEEEIKTKEIIGKIEYIIDSVKERDLDNAVLDNAVLETTINMPINFSRGAVDKSTVDIGKLLENEKYRSIMVELDEKYQELIDRNEPNAMETINEDENYLRHKTPDTKNPDTSMDQPIGGSKKRRTKKAKKLRKKRRYSRKH